MNNLVFYFKSFNIKGLLYFLQQGIKILLIVISTNWSVPMTSWAQASQKIYGCHWNVDGLANLGIGKDGRSVSYRFRAEHTNRFSQVRFYLVFRALGYYAGDGGEIRVDLQTDDGTSDHLPSGISLGYSHITDPMGGLSLRLFNFNTSIQLEKGKLYHFVFTNPDSDPEHNFVSIDNLLDQEELNPMMPDVTITDLAVLNRYYNGSWNIFRHHTPIFTIYFENGEKQGQGYIDTRKSDGTRTISGSNKVRVPFTVTGGDKTVSAVSVRVMKSSGSAGLTVRLEHFDGTLIEQGTIPASTIKSSYNWVTYRFNAEHTLAKNQSYTLELSSSGGSYRTYCIQQGTKYNMDTPATFNDGWFQYTSGSTWQNLLNRTDFDLQFYFTVIETESFLTITTSSLPNGIIAESYNFTLNAINGSTPYNWSIINDKLPDGLHLSSDGIIKGTPIQKEQKSFTVQVRDANNFTSTKALSITIINPLEPDFDALKTVGCIIDGDLNEFIFTGSVSFEDNSERESNKDNNAIARIIWDDAYLYVGVEVSDTELNAVAIGNDNFRDLWKDDCIEIFLDPDSDGGDSMNDNDYRYDINLNEYVLDGNGFTGGWNWDSNILKKVSIHGTLNNNSDTDFGYTAEVAIPWIDLKITPIADRILGLMIGITDRDNEGNYEYFGWPISSNFNNPDEWAKVALVDSHSQMTAVLTLSDPSPTKAGSHTLTLSVSTNVIKIPTSLLFEESDGTYTTINLSGPVPGTTFTGMFTVDNNVADGIGSFTLSSDALEDEYGNSGNRIISGASVRIDQTVPTKPTGVTATFEQ